MGLRQQEQIFDVARTEEEAKKGRGWDGVRFGGAAEMID